MSLLIVLGIHTPSFGFTWQKTGGPIDGFIQNLAINPAASQTIYAGTFKSGVFKTLNSGGIWSPINNGLTDVAIYALAIDPYNQKIIYAGTSVSGVWKSSNSGDQWSAAGLTDKGIIFSLAIAPTSPQTIYAGTEGGGIFKSTDGGTSWNEQPIGIQNLSVRSLAIDPITPRTVYAACYWYGVYKSTDGGTVWTAMNEGLNNKKVEVLAIDPTTPQTVYAGTAGGGIFKSINGGASWSAVNTGLGDKPKIKALAINPSNTQIIYAGTWNAGAFRSTNGGASWADISMGIPNPGYGIYALAIDPATPAKIYAGTYGDGVFTASDVTYTVTFDSNGGSTVPSQIVDSGATVTKPNDPLKAGHTFAGWFTDQALTIPYDFKAQVTGNFTLYAKWEIVRYKLTLNIFGNGTVNNITPPPIFNCDKASCSGTFDWGTGFTFRATPAYGSTFGEWSGCTSINVEGDCVVTIANATTITAPFNLIPPVRIGNNYYQTLSKAYEAAGETGITLIETKAETFIENLLLDKDKAIQFQGGFDAVYSTPPTGMTAVNGKVTIGKGSLNAKALVIW